MMIMKLNRGLSRRDFLRLGGVAAAGAFVPASRALMEAAARTPAAQAGGAVVMAIGTEPVGIDPCNPWFLGSGLWGMLGLPYDSWWIYDRDLNIQPSAAESWERRDETTVIFNIRPGIRYHGTGRELVADDVVWSHERVINPDLGCMGASAFSQHVASVTATGTYQFEVKLNTPNLLLSRIPLPSIIDPTQVEAMDAPLMMQAEAGTGPWILDQWVTENYISFRRNDDYWGNVPQFEEFRFQVMPEERATVAAMRAGQLNFLPISRIENFLQLESEPDINTWAGPSLEIRRLNINHFRESFQNPDVLQAVRYGLNRQQFVDILTQGYGKVSGSMSPAVTSYALADEEIAELQAYDPDRARSLLSNAGYDMDSNRLRLDLLSIAGFKDFTDIAQIVQANLREVGIDVEIRIQEVGVWVDSRIERKDYDMSVNDWGTSFDPNYTFYRSDQSEQAWTGGADPRLDELIDASNTEQDEEKRRQHLQDIQRLLIENVREIYLYSPPAFEAASNKIRGYTPWPGSVNLRVFDLEGVTVEG
jgi:peptide/nickel transport system substrate-binding protein